MVLSILRLSLRHIAICILGSRFHVLQKDFALLNLFVRYNDKRSRIICFRPSFKHSISRYRSLRIHRNQRQKQ